MIGSYCYLLQFDLICVFTILWKTSYPPQDKSKKKKKKKEKTGKLIFFERLDALVTLVITLTIIYFDTRKIEPPSIQFLLLLRIFFICKLSYSLAFVGNRLEWCVAATHTRGCGQANGEGRTSLLLFVQSWPHKLCRIVCIVGSQQPCNPPFGNALNVFQLPIRVLYLNLRFILKERERETKRYKRKMIKI